MTETLQSEPYEVSLCVCSVCGASVGSVAPVGTPWPRECSCGCMSLELECEIEE